MPHVKRGEVWQIDFGMAAKVRPALVLGCDIAEEDRVLVAVVFHTTALRGSRYEVPMKVPGLSAGGFDAQSLYTIPAAKLIRQRAALTTSKLREVEERVRLWLEL
ncbi:MAG: type II toxin-antitoxin system PemK/MazF family toxin [Verrucomicrobiales bacterium]